jgi:hypothetical protein
MQGLVPCQKCGYAFSRTSTYTTARKLHYYKCIGSDSWRKLGGPVCDNRMVRQDLLDQIVWTEVIRLLEDPTLIQEELDRRPPCSHVLPLLSTSPPYSNLSGGRCLTYIGTEGRRCAGVPGRALAAGRDAAGVAHGCGAVRCETGMMVGSPRASGRAFLQLAGSGDRDGAPGWPGPDRVLVIRFYVRSKRRSCG